MSIVQNEWKKQNLDTGHQNLRTWVLNHCVSLWVWLVAEHLPPMHKTLGSVLLPKKETENAVRLLRHDAGQVFFDPRHRKILNTVNGCTEGNYDTQWLNPPWVSDSNTERPRNVRTTAPGLMISDFQTCIYDFKTRSCICVCGVVDRIQGLTHASSKCFQFAPYLGVPYRWPGHSFSSLSKSWSGGKIARRTSSDCLALFVLSLFLIFFFYYIKRLVRWFSGSGHLVALPKDPGSQ